MIAALRFAILVLCLAASETVVSARAAQSAMMGMKIDHVSTDSGVTEIVVTGSRFILLPNGTLSCSQRIPRERKILEVQLGSLGRFKVEKEDDFSVVASSPRLDLIFQGDSLVIFRARVDLTIRFKGLFKPAYRYEKEGRQIFIDGTGGFGLFPVMPVSRPVAGAGSPGLEAEYRLAAGDELWVSIFPPRAANPARTAQAIAHEGTASVPYPPNDVIRADARYCKVLAIHAYFWSDVPDSLKPKTGKYANRPNPWLTPLHIPYDLREFTRVRDEAHRLGMKVVVYLSPYYSTAPDIGAEMRRVVHDYQVDGLYFDGISMDFRKSYRIVRQAREILGGDRILYVHCTSDPLGSGRIYCPFIDSYADYILRGEAGRQGLDLFDFLRWTVSGSNISNAVGYWCYYGSTGQQGYVNRVPTEDDIDAALGAGVRIWRTGQAWSSQPRELARFDKYYFQRARSAR